MHAVLPGESLEAQLESLVRENLRLRRQVDELESFTRLAAHDLVAPLRHIISFTQRAKVAAAQGAPASLPPLDTVLHTARRAQQMVTELLQWAQARERPLVPERVRLDHVVAQVHASLLPDCEGRDVEWTFRPLPAVEGDATLLHIAVQQLLSNAVKYTRDVSPARITVHGERTEAGDVVVTISDNGVGFDSTGATRLFEPFVRLHPTSQFEGTGLGLATVKAVAERHGGSIEADSRPGGGATFRLTLGQLGGISSGGRA